MVGEGALHLRGGGVKNMWTDCLGSFREEELISLASIADRTVVIDVSAWVHKMDGVHEIAYARTNDPPYAHPALIHSFDIKVQTLKALDIKPIFVFDGISPPMKKIENMKRQKKSNKAKAEYDEKVKKYSAEGINWGATRI